VLTLQKNLLAFFCARVYYIVAVVKITAAGNKNPNNEKEKTKNEKDSCADPLSGDGSRLRRRVHAR
jgi:hypothetical protein